MAALEPVDIPTQLKKYPYFMAWLKELGRSPEEVLNFYIAPGMEEVPSDTDFKKFKQTDSYTVGITFKDKVTFTRTEKWSEGKMTIAPEEKEQ